MQRWSIVLALKKPPLLSLTTFPCEMDGLVELLDEDSGLQLVVHISCIESEHALVEFGRWHLFQCWLCLGGCLLKAKEPRGCQVGRAWQLCWPAGLLACLSTSNVSWHNCELSPSKLRSCIRQSHRCLPWINNLSYWDPVGQSFPVPAALPPF